MRDFPSLVTFGERLVDARPRRLRRRLGTGGLTAFVALVGTTGAALTAATGSPVPPFLRASGEAAILRPEATTVRISPVRAADPGAGAPWGVRVGTAADGTRCVTAGQVSGGRLGIERRDGRFDVLGASFDAQCGQSDGSSASPGRPAVVGLRDLSQLTRGRTDGTVLFGVADPETDAVRVLMPNGRRVAADLASDGAFVAVLPGEPRQAQPIVELRRGGAGVQVPFQLPRTLPDPSVTGSPFTLIAEQVGQRVVDGRPIGRPNPTCFRLAPTVRHPRAGTRGPAVCGLPRGSWASVTPLRRDVRGRWTLGRQPRGVEWSGLPTRTLVVVRAPSAYAVVRLRFGGRTWAVRRAGAEIVDARRSDGVYVGLLPGVVSARSVGVQVQPLVRQTSRSAAPPRTVAVRQVDLENTRRTAP